MTKRCPRCKKQKPVTDFRKNGYCKPCALAYFNEWYRQRYANDPGFREHERQRKNRGRNNRKFRKAKPQQFQQIAFI